MTSGFEKYQKHNGIGGGDDPHFTPFNSVENVTENTFYSNNTKNMEFYVAS